MSRVEVRVLFGSQFGKSQNYANILNQQLQEIERVSSSVDSLDNYIESPGGQIIVIISSTFGMGGPPENASMFYNLISEDKIKFDGTLFSVLGVGDSRWATFCAFPRLITEKLSFLGAKKFHPVAEVDVADDSHESVAREWIQNAVNSISNIAQALKGGCCESGKEGKESKGRIVKKEKRTLSAPLEFARYLTNTEEKKIIHLGLNLQKTPDFGYNPGDCLAIYPENDANHIELVLNHLEEIENKHVNGWDPSNPELSLEEIITSQRDLNCILSKDAIASLINYVRDPTEKTNLSQMIQSRGIPQLNLPIFLQLFPSTCIKVKWMLEHLNLLSSRHYSISCSPLVFPHSVHIVFTVVDHPILITTQNGQILTFRRKGTCTAYLERLTQTFLSRNPSSSSSLSIKFALRVSNNFHLPTDLSQHILMVGAGTGVSPFRSFLQHLCFLRQKEIGTLSAAPKAFGCETCPMNLLELLNPKHLPDMEDRPKGMAPRLGENWLFFGCRHPDLDFLFQDEFEALNEAGALNVMEIAFSRLNTDNDNNDNNMKVLSQQETGREEKKERKKYVQHLLHKKEKEIVDLLISRSAYLFVCGNMNGMLRDTHEKLKAILHKQRGMSLDEAQMFLDQLASEKRYLMETWT